MEREGGNDVSMDDVARAGDLAHVAADRTRSLLAALRHVDDTVLDEPSALPGWSRLTIICHLRYGTKAMLRMTQDALAGRETAYYPQGRASQRPITLRPAPGQTAQDVLDDWESVAIALDTEWSVTAPDDWAKDVREPPDNPDLGTIPLGRLTLARLTETDVHGTDLAIGAPDWSDVLVDVGLPVRLGWLSTRRSNHREFDPSLRGSWLLTAAEGLRWLVAVDGELVQSRPATDDEQATATIGGSARDLLALLLGRPRRRPLRLNGDIQFARSFADAFPGP
jgi:uncharacterized protein (TIGR03083 family)